MSQSVVIDGAFVAVDFDGTCVHHDYPRIGSDVPGAVDVLSRIIGKGAKLILYTMRSGDTLTDAVEWFARKGLILSGVNTCPGQETWTASPKAFAHVYIDDSAVGCPLTRHEGKRPTVDWSAVAEMVGV